jgi:hypothetical protein
MHAGGEDETMDRLGPRGQVISFGKFKARKARERLPLFEHGQGAGTLPEPASRTLTTREVEHRRRMLRHLGSR